MEKDRQLDFEAVARADRRLPLRAWEKLVERLEQRSHGCRERARSEGAPRVYRLHGTYPQLLKTPGSLPFCQAFRARRHEFGARADPVYGDLVAAWSLCGRDLPAEGEPFYALCTQTKRIIGWGRVALTDGQVLALLNKGRAGDFLPYSTDAYGLILIFCWTRNASGVR